MLFTSPLFLFAFLPAAILSYYALRPLLGNRAGNWVLLLFSYLFYTLGTGRFALILLGATSADYICGLLIEHHRPQAKWWLALSVAGNLGLLAYFKYANFFIAEFNAGLAGLDLAGIDWPTVALPVGISFFTFQKISYTVDVYRRHTRALDNFTDFALYVAMFPQLVAGPIVRFKDIWDQLRLRRESWDGFYTGALRFCWGLAKKVLIADACGQIADVVFDLGIGQLDTKTAWMGGLAYTLQIYFDFSGYSDMAIGMARLFGFHLLENFDRPYGAVSVTDFWRRWHISLSRWFRDYLYVPLGGNRRGPVRTYANLAAVFLLCGLWHGANWTFVCWGLYHGLFLILERISGLRTLAPQRWPWLRRPATLVVLIFGWVLFRADTLSQALAYAQTMLVWVDRPVNYALYSVLHYRNLFFMGLAAVATLAANRLPRFDAFIQAPGLMRVGIGIAIILAVLPYCAAFVTAGAGNPFIYFRF